MSSHYVFEVHVKTPGEDDSEEAAVEAFAALVQKMAELFGASVSGVEVDVHDVRQN